MKWSTLECRHSHSRARIVDNEARHSHFLWLGTDSATCLRELTRWEQVESVEDEKNVPSTLSFSFCLVLSQWECKLGITCNNHNIKWTTQFPQHLIHTFQPPPLHPLTAYRTNWWEEIILARLSIGYTLLTQSHLTRGNDPRNKNPAKYLSFSTTLPSHALYTITSIRFYSLTPHSSANYSQMTKLLLLPYSFILKEVHCTP